MRRLYQKIYLAFLASLVAVVVVSGVAWHLGQRNIPHGDFFELAGQLAQAALPASGAPREVQQRALERLGRRLRVDLGVRSEPRPGGLGRSPPSAAVPGRREGPLDVWMRRAGMDGPAARWALARRPSGPAAGGPLLDLVFFWPPWPSRLRYLPIPSCAG